MPFFCDVRCYTTDMDLDIFDRRLLTLVQQDAGLTAEQLAEKVPLSASAIQRRIRRLRDRGVILKDVSVCDPKQLGRPTFFIVSLQVERERPEMLAELKRWLSTENQVQQVYYVTGEADFVLVVTASDTESYDDLMSRLVSRNPNVRRFTTNVALGVVKRGLAIALPEASNG